MNSPAPTLEQLDPRALVAHPTNVRSALGDLRPLARSIRAVGILEPLVVVPDGAGHRIIAGHRRCAAAIDAGQETVPCLVRPDLAGAAEQVAGMLVENTQRLALTVGDEGAGYERLAAAGLTDTAIARTTGTARSHISRARTVAASDVAATVATRYDLTLDQAVVLAEFDDDRDAVKALAVCAKDDPGRFEHLTSRLRQDRDRRQRHAETLATLAEAGVTVLDDEPGRGGRDRTGAVRLDALTHGGQLLTADDHTACPGHAAHVPAYQPDRPVYACTSPGEHGHELRHALRTGQSALPAEPEAVEERSRQRREVIEANKEWRAAEPVRLAYVQALLARRAVPRGTLRFVTHEILASPERVGDGDDGTLAELLAVDPVDTPGRRHVGPAHAATLPDARLPLALLAQVAADREATMGVHTWRSRHPSAARWLAFLAGTGYTLSAIEERVVDAGNPDDKDTSP